MLEQFPWLYVVIAGAVVVFISDLIGNMMARGRIINAIISALVFAIIFGALLHLKIVTVEGSVDTSKIPALPSTTTTTTGSGG
jgi:hypothetical protein